jgi:hypothetical protein
VCFNVDSPGAVAGSLPGQSTAQCRTGDDDRRAEDPPRRTLLAGNTQVKFNGSLQRTSLSARTFRTS